MYEEAIKLDSENPVYHNNKAAAHFEKQEFKESLAEAEAAIKCAPEMAKAHYRRAKVLYELCDTEKAVEAIRAAKKILDSGE